MNRTHMCTTITNNYKFVFVYNRYVKWFALCRRGTLPGTHSCWKSMCDHVREFWKQKLFTVSPILELWARQKKEVTDDEWNEMWRMKGNVMETHDGRKLSAKRQTIHTESWNICRTSCRHFCPGQQYSCNMPYQIPPPPPSPLLSSHITMSLNERTNDRLSQFHVKNIVRGYVPAS